MARQLFRLAPLLVSVLAVTLLVTGCMSQSPTARNTQPPPTVDMQQICKNMQRSQQTYCYRQIELATLTPQVFADRRDVWDYLELDWEEARRATREADRQMEDDYRADQRAQAEFMETQQALDAASSMRDALTVEAEYRNDAVRDCISAGYNETLCLLDPENPTGE
ncbi:MAG: hypothetical protein KC492_39655 [Myxococcales bacterium]|nr:hypothetical protein [Myxococcales bacterium]